MRKHPIFAIYGLMILGAATFASYRGITLLGTDTDVVRGVPKSIRDNPGAYRSIYSGYHRYSGGK